MMNENSEEAEVRKNKESTKDGEHVSRVNEFLN